MDWIEEKSGQLRKYVTNATLGKSLFLYMAAGCIAAFTLWLLTRNLCGSWLGVLAGESTRRDAWLDEVFFKDNTIISGEAVIFYVLWFFYRFSLYLYLVIAWMLAGRAFLKRKLYPAFSAVKESMNYIAAGDYGHEISYLAGDEMGMLCRDFDELRKKLIREKQNQWMNEESQRRINAAFAHDMRTPLTVLSGCTEFLQRYVPKGKVTEELLLEKLSVMEHQEQRLLKLSGTMSQLQREEAREVAVEWLAGPAFAESLGNTARELALSRGITCTVAIQQLPDYFFVDAGLVEEVFDNLISNALRYAKKQIRVELCYEEEGFQIFVHDDGKGFSGRALQYATDPYFCEEKESGEHFGIGLSICRMLCEKHGGTLRLVNSVEGGAIAAATFLATKYRRNNF